MFAALLVRPPLRVVVHLRLAVVHAGNGSRVEDVLGQCQHTGADHQRVGWLSDGGIGDGRFQGERLSVHSDVNDERVTVHACLDGFARHSGDASDAEGLNHVGDFQPAFVPVGDGFYLPSVVHKERVGEFVHGFRELCGNRCAHEE